MAADERRSPESIDTERTLLDSPDDTAPPEENATLITESPGTSNRAQPEATLADTSIGSDEAADATLIEPGNSVPEQNDDKTVVESIPPRSGGEPTLMMDSTVPVDESDDAATIMTPSVDPATGDMMSGHDSGGSATDATLLGDAASLTDDPEATAMDAGAASSSDPYDRTIVQQSGAGTASGTAAEYIPPEGSGEAGKYPHLGRFEIIKLLGQGAFGAVYLAHDPHLDRKVAIKVAKTGVLAGKEDVDRFMREARSAAQLRHPNIVPVYEVGQLPNTNFIAYEYVEGTTLGDVLKQKKKLSYEEAVDYMRKIASGLDYAHQHGIVHRDMKPDNVLLDTSNQPHIADFGLARRDEHDTTRTREGMFMGTPSYMSPEQASGKAHLADARSDVWSLGVMLQEMLTGVRPFRGNVTEVLVAVQNYEPPSIRSIDHNIPADLETIVEKCLTKNPEERYQSAEMLAEELERWQRGEPILARPINVFGRTWRWMKRNPQVASLIGAVVASVLIGSIGMAGFGWSAMKSEERAHQAALDRAESQLTSVRTAAAASLPVLVESLEPHRSELRSQLMELVGDKELLESEQSRVRLAAATLYPDAPEHGELVARSASDLLVVEPAELVVRTQMLSPFKQQVELPLWDAATDSVLPQRKRFAALASLASLRSRLPDWSQMTDDMVAEMLAMNPLELSEWLPAVMPIREQLESALTASFTGGDDPNVQYRAAIVLGKLFQDTPETLISLVPQARPQQLGPLLEALKPRADFFAERLNAQLTKTIGTPPSVPLSDEQAAKALNFALALLGLGRGESVWPLLDEAPNESLRTSLVHSIPPASISWQEIATRMEWEQDPGVIAALCLTLGEYGEGDLLPGDRERLIPGLLELFRTHPHAGVHGAAEWVLRRWGRDTDVDQAMAQLQSRERDPARNWHITPRGDTFAVIKPQTFQMGSTQDEPGEVRHRRLIPRTYGISFREVTIAEYMEFDPEFAIKNVRNYAPDDACPIINMKWYDAAAYCRWLSEKDGFEEHEMCYPRLEDLNVLRKTFGAKSLELPDDLLDRPGYRLPTAAEWEYAARGGTITSRPFGDSPRYVDKYAWYLLNSKDHAWPTGLLKPNNNGLFDIQGNALEWCQNYYYDTPPAAGRDGIVIDGLDNRDAFNRECRGGSDRYPFDDLRVPRADAINPGIIDTDFGFRIARTYVGSKAVESASTE